jgi:putative toxin-antitoxin system antitoxin component (TIGR02293 family)
MGKVVKKALKPAVATLTAEKNKGVTYSIVHWLGLHGIVSAPVRSDFDVIQFGRQGIPKRSLDSLAEYLGISRKRMAENLFSVSVKTLERKSPQTKLDRKTSSHALEIARVVQHAYEVFEDQEQVKLWLNRPNKALNNMEPVNLMDTLSGLNMVNDILGRIEEGVYS